MALLSHQSVMTRCGHLAVLCALTLPVLPAMVQESVLTNNEKELKVAFLYNFTLFTEWPPEVGSTLNLCLYGDDPFGSVVDALQGKAVGGRSINVQRKGSNDSPKDCQVVFFTAQARSRLPRVLDELRGSPVLTVADSPGAARQGAALNMVANQNKITFEVNLQSVRAARLNLSSKLLRLATEVIQ